MHEVELKRRVVFRTHMEPGFEHVSERTIEVVMDLVLKEIGVKASPSGELVMPIVETKQTFEEFAADAPEFPTSLLATANPPLCEAAPQLAAPRRASGKKRGPKRGK